MSLASGKAANEAEKQRSGKWLLGAEFGLVFRAPLEPSGSQQNSEGNETHRNPNKVKAWQETIGEAAWLFTQRGPRPLGGLSHLSPPIPFLWTHWNQSH